MWMLKGGIGEPPLGHYSTQTASVLHAAQFRPTTDAPEKVNLNDSKSMRNENETYMATVTDALESIMTNYDKRIRPGYGGMKEIVHLRKHTKGREIDTLPDYCRSYDKLSPCPIVNIDK